MIYCHCNSGGRVEAFTNIKALISKGIPLTITSLSFTNNIFIIFPYLKLSSHLSNLIIGIGLFALDFAGSGHSEGEYISLGKYEVDDIKAAVDYLRKCGKVSQIGLWGRSMGAVTALMYSAADSKISALVVDSPFSSLKELAMELAQEKSSVIPCFLLSYILGIVKN